MRKKGVKRYQAGGATTSSNVPLPASAPRFTSPSQPGFGGGTAQAGPPYFPDYSPPGALASKKVFRKGGKVKSASARADGCAIKGKTRAR